MNELYVLYDCDVLHLKIMIVRIDQKMFINNFYMCTTVIIDREVELLQYVSSIS